jgi:hypothetical protein
LNGGADPLDFDRDDVCIRAGAMAASMTILQAFWRELRPGEDRVSLVRKCIRALSASSRGKLMKPHACVHACTHDLQDVVGVPAVTTPDHSGQKRTSQHDAAGSAKMAKN